MKIFLVTFKDKRKEYIADVSVIASSVVFAVSAARNKLTVDVGCRFVQKLDREVDSVTIEELT